MKPNKLIFMMLGIIFIMGLPHSILGQFSVIATIPADGALNVDPAITFQISFSEPLDTTARFDYPSEFFLNAIIHPDTLMGEPDSITLSPDLKTVYVHNLKLWPDTRYMLLIANALSSTRDSLSIPYLVTFTTGTSLPTATVSGTVSYPGSDASGTAVILFNAPMFAEENLEADNATIVQTSSGNYTINYVSPGTYWPVGVNDFFISAEGDLIPNVSGSLGFYDPDANGIPDSIIVSEGQQLSGIDLSLFSLAPVIARYNYPTVADSAQNWASDAVLVELATSGISPEGKATSWMYAFYSPTLATFRGWISMGTLVMPMELWELPETTTALPANWLDSDIVANIAADHGGRDFLATHPDAFVAAFLTTIDVGSGSFARSFDGSVTKALKSRLLAPGKIKAHSKIWQLQDCKPSFSLQKYQSIKAGRAVWAFIYFTEAAGPELSLMFDAVTGECIQQPQPTGTTARFNLDAANQAAKAWVSDAALVWLQTHQSNLSPNGKAEMWFYAYYSASLDSGQAFFFSNGMQVAQMGGELPFKAVLPPNWIDSDVAINTAEAHGGSQYRMINQNVMVTGGLSRALLTGQPDRPFWQFGYSSSTADPLNIFVDAVTGEYISEPQPVKITARHRLQDVNQEAKAWAADAVLTFVGPQQPLLPDGTCITWSYGYYSQSKGSSRVFYAMASGPISSESPITPPPSTEALPDNWIDSDAATAIAEANGGSVYRSSNQGVVMVGMISCNQLGYWGKPSKAVWKFIYASSTQSHIIIYVDAVTGTFIPNSDPILTKARYNLEAANYLAQALGSDAKLVYVMNNVGNLTPNGESEAWLFVYYSTSQDQFRSFQIMSGQWAFTWSSDGGLGSKDALPDGWIDSDQATSIADAHGGSNFRATFADTRVEGLLTKNYPLDNYDIPPEKAVWRIRYNSTAADSDLIVLIDAVTGEYIQPITTIETGKDSPTIPVNFSLHQNYPNPFNPETTIAYGLPCASNIEIIIFNLQGERIATVVKNYQSAGFHQVNWDGSDENGQAVASGVYLYQLKAGEYKAMKKMLLIR